MKKIIFFFILFGGVILPFSTFAISCERNPGTDVISNQESFTYFCTDIFIPNGFCTGQDCTHFQALIDVIDGPSVCSTGVEISDTISVQFTDYPLFKILTGESVRVYIWTSDTGDLVGGDDWDKDCLSSWNANWVEESWDTTYFSLISEKPAFNIIPLQLDFPEKILTYPNTILNDLIWLLALIIGLPLAFWFIRKVINLIRLG